MCWRILSTLLTTIALTTCFQLLPLETGRWSSAAQAQPATRADHQAAADQGFEQGREYFKTNQIPAAIATWKETLRLYQAIGYLPGVGNTLNYLGLAYYSLNEYDKAIAAYEEGLNLARQMDDRQLQSLSLSGLGLVHLGLAEYSQAIDYYRQNLAIARELEDRDSEQQVLSQLGFAHYWLNNYDQAIDYYRQSLAIARELEDRDSEQQVLFQMGYTFFWSNDYGQAIDYYQQSLAIAQERGDPDLEGMILSGLGETYFYLGNYARAQAYHQQSLDLFRQARDRKQQGTSLNQLGKAYAMMGRFKEAIAAYEGALAIARETGVPNMEGNALSGLGLTYLDQQETSRAIAAFEGSLTIYQQIGNWYNEGAALGNLGHAYVLQENYPKAIELFQQQVSISQENGELYGEGEALIGLGFSFFHLDDLPKAEQHLRQGVAVLESIRGKLRKDEFKVSLFDTQTVPYQLLQRVLVAQNKTNAALEVAERGRARAFVELLARQYATSRSLPISSEPLTIEQIQHLAQAQQTTLVEYSMIGEQTLYIWVVRPTGEIAFESVDLSTADLSMAGLVARSRNAMGVRGRAAVAILPPASTNSTENLQKLHQILIDPIAHLLPTDPNEKVTIIPQEQLFLVPFPALQDSNGTYLIEKHTLLTAPAIQVLQLATEKLQQVSGTGALVVGNPTMPSITLQPGTSPQPLPPLLGAEQEALAIAEILDTQALTASQATEAAIIQRMPQAEIIHLATHGLLEYGIPSASGVRDIPGAIALAPSQQDDGLLTAGEILDLKLNAELVVLSACDTGRGKITGDGVIGLSRSLITAGVPSVIVSLWSVPDAPTADLMTEFYRQLRQTPNKAQALRLAMLSTLDKHPQPRDWAAFTLIGAAQ